MIAPPFLAASGCRCVRATYSYVVLRVAIAIASFSFFCQKADLHQSHGPDWQGFALEVPVHLRGCRPRRGLHTRPHSRVHPARRGAATTFLICTLSRALLHAGIHEVVPRTVIDRKGQNFGHGQNFYPTILPKPFGFRFHFGRKRIFGQN